VSLAGQTTPLIAALEQLGPHDHFCSIYESPEEHYAAAIPYIRIGLDRGEKCIYIADDGPVGDVREAMQLEGIDVDRAITSNALVLSTKEQAYLEHGSFRPDWMFTFWKEATKLAMSEGFSALRATGETEWVLRGGRGLERWMEYESKLTHTLAENNCSALCQYNRNLFPPELILDVIRTHPTVVYDGTVCRNLYYVPPEEFLGENQTAREVERLLTNIRERERMEDALREQLMERRRAEEALRRSESYLAEAQKLSHTGSWAFDATTPLYWSEENLRIWGFDPQQGLPDRETIVQRIHPEDRDRVLECVQNAFREKRDYAVEFRIVLPDAAVRYIHGLGHPAFGASGELVEIVGTNVDVTDRKRSEEAQLRLAAIVASSDDAIISKTLGGVITSWNAGAERIFGYRSEEAIGLPITTLIPRDRQDEESQIIERVRRGESVHHFETVRIRKDGREIQVSLTISPIKDAAGQIIGVSKIARDITERNRAAEALREAQTNLAHVSRVTTMGELVASIAHEVNQPLGAIVTNGSACLRLLFRETPDLEKSREVITRMINDGLRASEVIKRIRDLLHKSPPEKAPLSINETIQEVIALVSSEVLRSKVELRAELAADLPPVVGDRIQLQQVILNLILNARDAMSDVQRHPRELLITSKKTESGEVVIAVRDSGQGLDPKDAERIFDPFFTTKAEGMGLGLSISRTIIEAHGGTLWAKPNKDRGATIQFTLPLNSGSES